MSPIQQPVFQPSATVTIDNATECRITNLSVTNANTEETHSLVDNLKQLRIRCRQDAVLKYSFTLNESGTKYWTIFKGTCENITGINFTSKNLYIQSSKNSVDIEIAEFY